MRVERTKMCRATWESLKAHIIRQRKRKKDEMEADAEEARQKQKREQLKKQHKSTLQETVAEIQQSETRLQELKEVKHEMFLKLKKVLNEDETRRRQQLLKDTAAVSQQLLKDTAAQQLNLSTHHLHPQHTLPLQQPPTPLSHQHLLQQSPLSLTTVSARAPLAPPAGPANGRLPVHKMGVSQLSPHGQHKQQQQQLLSRPAQQIPPQLPPQAQQQQQFLPLSSKRARSPSPPVSAHQPHNVSSAPYRHGYLYKSQPTAPYMGFQSLGSSQAIPHVVSRADDKHHAAVYLAANRGYAVASHGSTDVPRDKADYYGPASHRTAPPPTQQQQQPPHSVTHLAPSLTHSTTLISQGGNKPLSVAGLNVPAVRGAAPLAPPGPCVAPPQPPAPQAHAQNLSRQPSSSRFYGGAEYR